MKKPPSRIGIYKVKDFLLWSHYNPMEKCLKHFNESVDIRFVCYPNEVPCSEVNRYILSKSKTGIGHGTLKNYAYELGFLVFFIFENKITFRDLTDNRFTLFIQGLTSEKDEMGDPVRKANQVRTIGRRCIDFLIFLTSDFDKRSLIGLGRDSSIRIKEVTNKIKQEGRKDLIEKTSYQHDSFPTANPENSRSPISREAAAKVRSHIQQNSSRHTFRRDMCLYEVLEQTGARAEEIQCMKVADVKQSLLKGTNGAYSIRMTTLKRKDGRFTRMVPIPHSVLSMLDDYIKTTRRILIKNNEDIGKANDHGFLFVSLTSGRALSEGTIGDIVREWGKSAGVNDKVHAHLFRHAFITNKLVELLLEHDCQTVDEFRKSLLNTNQFKMKLKEWTGHTMLSSLDHYIDLAFADIAGLNKTLDVVSIRSSIKSVKNQLQSARQRLASKQLNTAEFNLEMDRLLASFEIDLNRGEIQV